MFPSSSSLVVKSRASCAPLLVGPSCTCMKYHCITVCTYHWHTSEIVLTAYITLCCLFSSHQGGPSPLWKPGSVIQRLPWVALRRPHPHIHSVWVVYNALPPQHHSLVSPLNLTNKLSSSSHPSHRAPHIQVVPSHRGQTMLSLLSVPPKELVPMH